VFISPAWPAEFISHLPWRTPEAAASYAAFLLDEPEAWLTGEPSENRCFLNDLARVVKKSQEEGIEPPVTVHIVHEKAQR
jgi:hypothetical protein